MLTIDLHRMPPPVRMGPRLHALVSLAAGGRMSQASTPLALRVVDTPRGPVRGLIAGAMATASPNWLGGRTAVIAEDGQPAGIEVVGSVCLGVDQAPGSYRIVIDTSSASPLDVLAYLLAGANAVVDMASAVMPDLLAIPLLGSKVPRTALVVGSDAAPFAGFVQAVAVDWPSIGDDRLDLACFRSAVALAQLPVLRAPTGVRQPHSYVSLSAGLNREQERTGFHYTASDLPRVLRRLAVLWSPREELDEDDPYSEVDALAPEARRRLPDLARAHGFSPVPPLVAAVAGTDPAKTLFRTLKAIGPVKEDLLFGTTVLRFRAPSYIRGALR